MEYTMIVRTNLLTFIVVLLVFTRTDSVVLDFQEDFGGIPQENSPDVCQSNTDLLSKVLQHNASGNVIRIASANTTFHFHHGVYANHLRDTVLVMDGTMRFERNEKENKTAELPSPCFMIDKSRNVTLRSNHRGLIDGRGSNYWGVPGIGFLELTEHPPRLVRFNLVSDLLIENLIFQDSPYHTLYLEAVKNVTVRHCSIVARRTPEDGHSWIDLSAFNTDGIDVSGTDVHIHDVDIWTQDDCIAVKDNSFPPYQSTNMLFERVNCSGLGFAVGSIGGTTVRNITFRNSYLYRSVKGLYMKFHDIWEFEQDLNHNRTGLIESVTFENITMERPLQWPLWIGPAQQSDHRRPCHPNPCSLCWPQDPMAECNMVPDAVFRNLTLLNIQINNPKMSPGVIMGGKRETHNMIDGILFDNVRVTKGPPVPPAQYDRVISFPGLLQPIVDHYVPNFEGDAAVVQVVEGKSLKSSPTTTAYVEDYGGFWSPLSPKALPIIMVAVYVLLHVILVIYFRRSSTRNPLAPATTKSVNSSRKEGGASLNSMREPFLIRWPISRDPSFVTATFSICFSRFYRLMAVILFELLSLCCVYFVMIVQFQWGTPKWNRTNQYFRCTGVEGGIATGGTWPVPSCFTPVNPPMTWFDSTVAAMNALGRLPESTAARTGLLLAVGLVPAVWVYEYCAKTKANGKR
jgi:Glycosyl hydrolases family 28